MLSTLANHKLYAKLKKCDFSMEKVHFLGHIISKDGISVDPVKVATVENWPSPILLRHKASLQWPGITVDL